MKHSIVFKSKDSYSSFPLLSRTKKGNLLIGFFTAPRPDHFGVFEWKIMVSPDEGESWGDLANNVVTQYDYSILSPREKSDTFFTESKNRIVTAGSFGFLFNPITKEFKQSRLLTHCVYWPSQQKAKQNQYMLPDMKNVLTFPRFLKEGNLILIPVYGLVKESNLSRCMAWRSTDGGLNFNLYNMFPDGVDGNEMAFVKVGNEILAHIRSDNHPYLMESRSEDFGRTWTYPVMVRAQGEERINKPKKEARFNPFKNVIGGPPHLLRVSEENGIGTKILCTYGYRQEKMGIRAIVSNDEGRTWEGPIILREDGGYSSNLHKKKWFRKEPSPAIDIGYPVSIQLKDKSILTAYYITCQDRITGIETTKWRI